MGFSEKSNFFIKLPKTLSFSVKGFCGNFDEDPDNDLFLANDELPKDFVNPGIEIGNSFLVKENALDE